MLKKLTVPHYGAAMPDHTDTTITLSRIGNLENHDFIYDATINKVSFTAFVDTGESHLFLSKEAAYKCNIEIDPSNPVTVELGNGSTLSTLGSATAPVVMHAYRTINMF